MTRAKPDHDDSDPADRDHAAGTDDERLERELLSLRPAPPSRRLERLIESRFQSGPTARRDRMPQVLGPLLALAAAACLVVAAWSRREPPRLDDPSRTAPAAMATTLSAGDVAAICSLPPTPWGYEQARSISPQALALFIEHHATHLLPGVEPRTF